MNGESVSPQVYGSLLLMDAGLMGNQQHAVTTLGRDIDVLSRVVVYSPTITRIPSGILGIVSYAQRDDYRCPSVTRLAEAKSRIR
jgi:hypothetical protein